ncbi:hypothetical protein BC477_19955 [Clavibacter michiganensis subsp. michiganensis]|uniref:Uncharacterized protein n=1 Tax=Clavibacter michiganensis subsp. michiganensis TaxID=33013 RepID=A0A251XD40_CLAMM|nr:hypothetical protein BC477_19955 [Clavibacter michiganensis subsp. michiganensis]OUD99964.1 hypothetical protein CMMCAS07_19495 [Clavibacter michiganensis subsp. michiganensis]
MARGVPRADLERICATKADAPPLSATSADQLDTGYLTPLSRRYAVPSPGSVKNALMAPTCGTARSWPGSSGTAAEQL